jgi:hypothetical protein
MIYMGQYLLGRLGIVGTHVVEFLEEVERRLAVVDIDTVLHLVVLGEIVGRNILLHVNRGSFLKESELGQLGWRGGDAGCDVFIPNRIDCSLGVVID